MALFPSYSPIINSLLSFNDVLVQTIVVHIIQTKTIAAEVILDHIIDLKNFHLFGRTIKYKSLHNLQSFFLSNLIRFSLKRERN